MSLQQLDEDLDDEFVERARQDILAFTLYTKPDYQVGWHHRALAKKLNAFLRGEIQYLMVFMPPRHGKSELVSRRLPAYLHGIYPDDEIMAVSYLDTLAGDMTKDVQAVIDSKSYARIFPNTGIWPQGTPYTKGIRNSSEHHIKDHRGKYRGQGVGGSFTGKGANWIIVDDPIKGREIADSEAFRERLWNFWTNDLFSRLETNLQSGRRGQVLITQTRWHEDDLSGRLIDQMKRKPKAMQWDIVHFPAIKVFNDNPDDPRKIGDALWPQKYNLKALEEIKEGTTPRGWSAVYQQDPVPGDGTIFRDRMFEICAIPNTDDFDYTFITADTAYKEKQENDFTCFIHFGVKDDVLYVIDVWYDHIAAVDIEDTLRPFITGAAQHWGFRGAWVEPKGHGIYLNDKWRRDGLMIPAEEDIEEFFKDRKFDKVQRANNAAPRLAKRKIYINKNIGRAKELVAQCLGFPKMTHDDFVDALVDGIKKVYNHEVGILDVLGQIPKRGK